MDYCNLILKEPCSFSRSISDSFSRIVNICKNKSYAWSKGSTELVNIGEEETCRKTVRRHSLPVQHMPSARRPFHLSPKKRHQGIHVVYMDSNSKDDLIEENDDDDALELPDHNYSPSLQLVDLRDGYFSARLPLNALPAGHVTIRIRNYKMEVILDRRPSVVDDNHCICRSQRIGDIDLPIYINPTTLSFEIDDKTLYVTALTKGFHGGRRVSSFCEYSDKNHINFKYMKPFRHLTYRERAYSH